MREIRSRHHQTWVMCLTPGERVFFLFVLLLPVDCIFHETLCACVKPAGLETECNRWFPREMTSEKRVQKFHTDDASLPRYG